MTPEDTSAKIRIERDYMEREHRARRDMREQIARQADEIKRLEDALVEERARRIYPYTMPSWERLPEDDHTARTFGGMENRMGKASYRRAARQHLISEGKIGSGHVANRLTDEQRAAISRAIRCMTDPNYHFAPEERKHVAVLRAMLEDAT